MATDALLITLIEAINRQNALIEGLPDAIGRAMAKWLIKADLPNVGNPLRETVLAELGFQPAEIVDLLYPNLGKSARRAKAKFVSERLKR